MNRTKRCETKGSAAKRCVPPEGSAAKRCDVFTPLEISEMMTKFLHPTGSLLEPSVGKGDLLKSIKDLGQYDIDVFDIESEYLKYVPVCESRKHCTDFLKYEFKHKYKNIILNPPYIRYQELSTLYRSFIKNNWSLLDSGNIDIYQAFILKCLELLEENGVMVSITPSSWLYNKSCEKFKKYLFENGLVKEIIDFGSKKVFKGINVYCCITVFTHGTASGGTAKPHEYIYNGIKRIQGALRAPNEETLGSICKIKYGIATLRDRIYIHDAPLYNEPCWKQIFKVSKNQIRYIIYPYDDENGIINERDFKKDNPNTYQFLLSHREELSKRDKGKKKYEVWYAFGRRQGLLRSPSGTQCVYVSTMGPKDFELYLRPSILFYSGLMITPKSQETAERVVDIIKNNRDFIYENSSKRGSGWINITPKALFGCADRESLRN